MIEAIIFDCFGVLVGKGFPETYRAAGGDPVADRDFIDDLLGQTNLGHISEAIFHQLITKHLGISRAEWRAAVKKAEQPDLELLAYIEELHKSYKTAILSNANIGVIEYRISRAWLYRCFDEIIVSGKIGIVKPNPEIYTYCADKLGVSAQACLFLDDHEVYVSGARSVGMQSIVYEDFKQSKAAIETLLTKTS